MKKRILVLVVAHNAEKTVKRLMERFPNDLLKRADEILIADDASSDNTEKVAVQYKKDHKIKKMKVVKHEFNKGYGGNQKWGYNYAIKNNFDVVVMVHGDAQYPPEFILPLVYPIEKKEFDFVFGSRMAGHPLKGGMPLYKFIGNKFLTFIENVALGTRLTEFHSGFRAYRVKALEEIPFNLNTNDFHFDSQIIIQLVIAKKRIGEIVIPTRYGDEKSNVRVISYGLNILREIAKYYLNRLSLRKYPIYDMPKDSYINKAEI